MKHNERSEQEIGSSFLVLAYSYDVQVKQYLLGKEACVGVTETVWSRLLPLQP